MRDADNCPDDVQALEKAMDRRLPSTLATLYGPHLTCQQALAHAHLLVRIADTIPLLPHYTNLPASVADVYSFCTLQSIVLLKCLVSCILCASTLLAS